MYLGEGKLIFLAFWSQKSSSYIQLANDLYKEFGVLKLFQSKFNVMQKKMDDMT